MGSPQGRWPGAVGAWVLGILLLLCLRLSAADATNAVPAAGGATISGTNEASARGPAGDGIGLPQLEALIEGIKGDPQLEEDLRKRVAERYEAARALLLAAAESRRRTDTAAQLIASGPGRMQELTAQLAALDTAVSNELAELRGQTEALGVDELTQRLAVEQAAEATLKGELDAVVQRSTALETAGAKGREERATVEQKLRALESESAAPAAGAAPASGAGPLPREAEALQWVRRATQTALQSELSRLDQEQLSLPIETKLRLAERNLLTRRLERQQSRLKVLEEAAQRAREAEVRQVRRETAQTEQRLRHEHPAVRSLAVTNQAYALELELSERLLARARSAAEALKSQRKRLDEEVARTERQLAIAGMSEPMGEFLLDQRRQLIEAGRIGPVAIVGGETFRVSLRMISTNGLRRFRAEERLRSLAGVDDEVEAWYAERVTGTLSDEDAAAIRGQLRDLYLRQRDYLTRLVASYASLMEALSDALAAQTELAERQVQQLQVLENKLIWVPSSPPVGWTTFSALPASLNGIFGGEGRERFFAAVREMGRPSFWWTLVLLAVAWVAMRRRCRDALQRLSEQVRRVSTDTPLHTVRAFVVTLLLGAPPGLLLLAAGRSLVPAAGIGTARAVAEGLQYCGGFLAVAMVAYELCRPRGLAEAHFRWPAAGLSVWRQNLRWWIPVHTVLAFLAASAVHDSRRASYDSLARLVFLAAMGAMAVMLARLLHPQRGVLAAMLQARPEGWVSRTRRLWYPLTVGIPLCFAVLAVAGYTYTALRLTHQLLMSAAFVAASVVGYALVKRWFAVQERRLAVELALERRREARASREGAAESAEGGTEGPIPIEEPELDLAMVKEQTRRLLSVVLWTVILVELYLVWAPFLPALAFLDQKAIWTVTTVVDGKPALLGITVSSILGAAMVVLLTVVAVRNLPGVLEIAVLEKLPLQPGSRYAITSIVSYVLILVGVILAAGKLGVRWSQLTWIAAALSVGLGFGLQEIVANFVCGLLIFFERPVRVGDIVTVNEITGVISQIRIRATTIVDWDRKEYIVPNKEFITGRILNWTLSNTTNRIVITVGVAYGTNIERAVTLMREAAERHPEVMKDPAPTCFFEAFDTSSLRLVLRCFLPRLDRRAVTMHELHSEIERRLREAGIEIAFPQQDIHLRTVAIPPNLQEAFLGRGGAGGAPGPSVPPSPL